MLKKLMRLRLAVKQNILPVLIALSLLAAACGDGDGGGGGTTGTTTGTTTGPVDNTGKVWTEVAKDTSPDTSSDTRFSQRNNHATVVFNDGTGNALWVIGGDAPSVFDRRNDVWKSTDGITWTLVADNTTDNSRFSGRESHAAVVFNNGSGDAMYVIGGYFATGPRNDVWRSTDGRTWNPILNVTATGAATATQFSARDRHDAVVFNGAMWVIGGSDGTNDLNDVWSSTDGAVWNPVAAQTTNGDATATRFSARRSLKAVVLGNSMYVIGGVDRSTKNDVWSSMDGSTWSVVSANNLASKFSARFSHTAVVLNKALWVIGGYSRSERKKDVWKSTDSGVTWIEVTSAASFPGREKHTATVFNNAMWVIGGTDDINSFNDVWRSP